MVFVPNGRGGGWHEPPCTWEEGRRTSTGACLVKLAERYDEQLGLGSKPARHREIPIGLPKINIGASER